MKKMFFMAAIAALALSSCSSDEIVASQTVEDGAVSFGAYVGRENRATVNNLASIQTAGFGVYAYEQGSTAWNTYRASNTVPNFFYNQKVAHNFANYELKNVNLTDWLAITDAAIQDMYTADVTVVPTSKFLNTEKEALRALGGDWSGTWTENTDANEAPAGAKMTLDNYKTLTTSTPSVLSKLEVVGTWTKTPASITSDDFNALATTKQEYYQGKGSAEWTYSPTKYYSNNKDARHSFFAYAPYNASAKVVFSADGPSIRYTSTEDYDLLWALPTIDKKKADIDERITFNFKHALSKVSFDASTFVDHVHPAHDADLVAEYTKVVLRSVKLVGNVPSKGRVSLTTGDWTVEASEESAYEFCPAEGKEFNHTVMGDLVVSQNNMVIPTDAATKVQIQVVYDVVTTDATNPKNSSTITNTVTSVEEYDLVAGVAYMFHLDLGLTSVKFDATVADWNADEETDVDLPNNHKYHALSSVSISDAPQVMASLYTTTTEPSNHAVSDYWYSPATKVLKVGNGTAYTDADANAYYKGTELYVVSTAGSACSLSTPDAVSYGSTVKYYLLSAPTAPLSTTPVYSLNVNSKGQIQTGPDASLAASWVAPIDNAYYTFGGNLYQWK